MAVLIKGIRMVDFVR